MEFTKKFKLNAIILAALLVLGVAACAALGGISLGAEYTSGALRASDLLRDTLICVGASVILIFAFLSLRFEIAAGGAGALVLLCSAAIVAALTFAVRLPVGSWFLPIMLFVCGFSAYASIMVFGAVRENISADQQADRHMEQIADISTHAVLPRLIWPAITVTLINGMIGALGGAAALAFALTMGIAAVVCAYSSIFLTTALWVKWRPAPVVEVKKSKNKKKKKSANKK